MLTQCPNCHAKRFKARPAEKVKVVAGHRFRAIVPGQECQQCKETFYEIVALTRFDLLVAKALADAGVELVTPVTAALSLGPAPHPYRRIRRDGQGFVLAHKQWRARCGVDGDQVTVLSFATGYRARDLHQSSEPALELHRRFVQRFGYPGDGA